jgi:hypothetical protein
MKVNGLNLSGPNIEEVYIPRGNQVLQFIAQGVLDDSDFSNLCPRPEPPEVIKAGVGRMKNPEDPNFKKSLDLWGRQKTSWLVIQSLRATPGLEWDTVKYDDPNSWSNWEKDLRQFLTDAECQRLLQAVFSANGLSEQRIQAARDSFLAGRAEQSNKPSSQKEEQGNMPSGELVNGSVSNPRDLSTIPGTK